jgi:bacterioferritin (cytochrome b1)
MHTASITIIDTLNRLLEAEVNSIFRFVGESSPYLDRATADIRRPLAELHDLSARHARELAELIESLGGVPRVAHRVRTEEQYLAFLSLKFLLPQLIAEKDLILTGYQDARRSLGAEHSEVAAALTRIEAEQRRYLDVLQRHLVGRLPA